MAKRKISSSIGQVILNLLLNAIQHSRAFGGKTIEIDIASSVSSEDLVEINIIDSGFGINWADRDKLFDMYYTTRTRGSGLGLYVSKLIVESEGGILELDSSHKLLGSCFRMELPTHGQ